MIALKHYRLAGCEPEEAHLLFEVRLDLHDVRSGYSDTQQRLLAGPWLEEPELEWIPDMVTELDWSELEEIGPPAELALPADADERAVAFLLRYFEIEIWANPDLKLYSEAGESRSDFELRCRELAATQRAEDLQKIKEIYLHRFLEMEQRALREIELHEWGTDVSDQKAAATRTAFSRVREDLDRWFSRRGLTPLAADELNWSQGVHIETAERLEELKVDFLQRYRDFHDEIESLGQVEVYRVPVTYSQVGVEIRAVLWK